MLDVEGLGQRIRNRCGERLQEGEPTGVGDLLDPGGHLAVVDRGLDPVDSRLGQIELDVEEKRLLVALLLVEHAVAAEDLQPMELENQSIALAAVSASTVSRTSWTRRIVAPRS